MGVTAATHKPSKPSPKKGVVLRKGDLRNVVLKMVHGGVGEWEWGSEQGLVQPLKSVLMECRGELSVLADVHACAAGHLQKCHLSSFYGWETSLTEQQDKDPQGHMQAWGWAGLVQVHPGLSHGVVLLFHTGPTATCCLPSEPMHRGKPWLSHLPTFCKCSSNSATEIKFLLLPGWNYPVWECYRPSLKAKVTQALGKGSLIPWGGLEWDNT